MRAGETERRLAILLASTADHRAAHAVELRRLAATADYDALSETFKGSRLLPLLGTRLVDGAPEAVPDTFREILEGALAHGRRRATLVEQIALQLVRALDDAGLAVVPLKGPHLAERLYGDAGMRTSNDIDLLVQPEDFPRAIAVLGDAGYTSDGKAPWRNGLPLFESSLRSGDSWRPPIDLHWRLHWYEASFSRLFIERCERDAHGVRIPRPVDDVTSLLLFWSRDGLAGLRHAADVGAWWDRLGADLMPGALDEIVASHPTLRPSLTAAALHGERAVGLPADRLLSDIRRAGRRVRLAVRCAEIVSPSTQRETEASVAMVDALLTPRGGGRAFIGRHLLPPKAVIADVYGLPPGARVRGAARRIYFAARVGADLGMGSAANLRRAMRHARGVRSHAEVRAAPSVDWS